MALNQRAYYNHSTQNKILTAILCLLLILNNLSAGQPICLLLILWVVIIVAYLNMLQFPIVHHQQQLCLDYCLLNNRNNALQYPICHLPLCQYCSALDQNLKQTHNHHNQPDHKPPLVSNLNINQYNYRLEVHIGVLDYVAICGLSDHYPNAFSAPCESCGDRATVRSRCTTFVGDVGFIAATAAGPTTAAVEIISNSKTTTFSLKHGQHYQPLLPPLTARSIQPKFK